MFMKRVLLALLVASAFLVPAGTVLAQGVTTGVISGVVTDAQKQPVAGAGVIAIHIPSGTVYETVTRADGRFSIPGMRVGGPYTVTVESGSGTVAFQPQVQENITVNLGVTTDVVFNVRPVLEETVTVTAQSDTIMSSERTGAATSISRETLSTLPTFQGQLSTMTRLTPESGGNMQFAGQDNRLNNITVDGSYFNNSFGLAGTPGERTGVAPISLAAIEQVQVSVAPFDVRQGNFVGAAVNTVTRSGTNQFRGSAYHQWRDEGLVGTEAGDNEFDPGEFTFRNSGGWAAGPFQKNKGFFFVNFEKEKLQNPGTTFRANTGGEAVGGNITRVLASDLDALSTFLQSRYGYETGPYQGYQHETPATRFLARVDYNLNDKNKLSLRYNYLDSFTDVLASNSSSLGFGNRRSSTQALNFQNSNYQIIEDIRSFIGEWNAIIGTSMANSLIVGYTTQDESRASRGTFFPIVDILEGGQTYTTFGFEPFTPNNELRYNTFQLQNNFTKFGDKHSFTFGYTAERYESENVFFPGSQSAYVFNSLNDFYTAANGGAVNLRRFQLRWANIPGMEKPIQPLEVFYTGGYAQDDWRVLPNLRLTAGVRVDVPFFGETGFSNPNANALTFRDEDGSPVQYDTSKLPDANLLWSPRVGFNWDVTGDRQTQVRGGTGIFTGRPAYVWISNQIGNTGVLTGFEQFDNTTLRPFNPDPNFYKPTSVTGDPASSYELALTNPDFKFPQLWRNNIAIDRRLPGGWTGTVEFLYNRDVNGTYYINANLSEPNSAFVGADTRPRWVGGNRIHSHVANAIVLKNQNVGRSWNFSTSAERSLRDGLWVKTAYSYGEAKNTVDPGSIAFGSWNNNQHSGTPNNPGLGYAGGTAGHRLFLAASYTTEWFRFGGTTFSMFWESRTAGNASYTLSGDLNGDGGSSNDLIYIPRDTSEMNFETYTDTGRTYTAAEQTAAWEAFINQDEYLSQRRGQYAERGAVFLPIVHNLDFSVAQDLFANIGGRRNSFQFRADFLNFANLINSDWGVGQRMVMTQPLTARGADSQGRALYRLRAPQRGGDLIASSFEPTAGISDVWRVQFSLRYTF
jgi:hypothetical protein